MKKTITILLLLVMSTTVFTSVAFAMTEEEVLKAVEENEGKYEMGGPLTKEDFIVFTTVDEYEKYDCDKLIYMMDGNWKWTSCLPNTTENLELIENGGLEITEITIQYTYRGISLDDRGNSYREVDPSLYNKNSVIKRYGIGVSGNFDPQNDEVYKWYNHNKSNWAYATIMENSCTWLLYNYKDIAQIKFYFDSDDNISYVIYYNGIQEKADRETTQTIQEYLNENGYDCGTPDGIAGKKTKAALKQFQEDHSLYPSGYIDDCLMKYLDGKK